MLVAITYQLVNKKMCTIELSERDLGEAEIQVLQNARRLSVFPGRLSLVHYTATPAKPGYNNAILQPRVDSKIREFAGEISKTEALGVIEQMLRDHAAATRLVESVYMPEYERLTEEQQHLLREKEAAKEAEKRAKVEAALAARREKALIPWKENGTAICNLYEKVMAISGLTPDHRFKSWIKRVTGIDAKHNDGFMYSGDFVKDRTVEIRREAMVFIVAVETGTNKYHTTTSRIVQMDADGVLHLTDIEDDGAKPGWALRLRDEIAQILGSI